MRIPRLFALLCLIAPFFLWILASRFFSIDNNQNDEYDQEDEELVKQIGDGLNFNSLHHHFFIFLLIINIPY